MSEEILKINRSSNAPIGIFDSGIGGMSVMCHIRKLLPHEDIYYLSDPNNAPYGTKSASFIAKRTCENVVRLISLGCKLIVVACNTATAVSIKLLRKKFSEISIVGLEPALRPAAELYSPKDTLVLATPLTLSQKRFIDLRTEFETETNKFVCIASQNTVSHVENMTLGCDAHIYYLKELFAPYGQRHFSACVLGCTHFPFAKNDISNALGYAPHFFDGGEGSAKRVETLLVRGKLFNEKKELGKIMFSDETCKTKYRILLNKNIC